jgi:hypothetical protein
LLFNSPFSNANFDNLQAGDFFFHTLSGEQSPAIKVVRADGKEGVVDFHMEQQNGRHLPTLVSKEGFENITVIAVQQAVIRPKPGLAHLKNGSGGASVDRAALIMMPGQTLVRVRGHALSTLSFDVATGQQVNNPDTAKCLWAAEWQIIITENDKDQVLFEKKE